MVADGCSRRGFTLIELLLVVVLLMVLATVTYVSVGGMRGATDFSEGLYKFDAGLRLARADAPNLGRRLRLEFDSQTGATRVMIEPKPLDDPGQFVEYIGCTWSDCLKESSLRVLSCRLTGNSAYVPADEHGSSSDSDAAALQAITFYPNGRADSAVIALAPVDQADDRRAVMEITPLGQITQQTMSAQEYEEYSKQPANPGGGS